MVDDNDSGSMVSAQRLLAMQSDLRELLDSYWESLEDSDVIDKSLVEFPIEVVAAFEDNLQAMTKQDALEAMWGLVGDLLRGRKLAGDMPSCSQVKTWEVSVSAIYVGSVSIQAASEEEAVKLARDRVLAGELNPDLEFSGYTAFDTPELLDEEDQDVD